MRVEEGLAVAAVLGALVGSFCFVVVCESRFARGGSWRDHRSVI